MVTIVSVKPRKTKTGNDFCVITVAGGTDVQFSKSSGQPFIKAKRANIISNNDYDTCLSLVGSQLPGEIVRVKCDEYSFTTSTGHKIKLDYRYQYVERNKIEDLQVEIMD